SMRGGLIFRTYVMPLTMPCRSRLPACSGPGSLNTRTASRVMCSTYPSANLIHSLYIPAFRIKEDAVPGLKTHLWFKADEVGSFDIFCTEYCGTGHSHMLSKVVVMADNEFDKWYASAEAAGAKERGMNLLQVKGCLGCHTTDGTKKIGPSFKGLFGMKETVITDGKEHEIIVDEAFIRKAVLQPGADLVKGYPKIMPQLPVTPEELDAIVAALKELK